jgi:hypothetical protein
MSQTRFQAVLLAALMAFAPALFAGGRRSSGGPRSSPSTKTSSHRASAPARQTGHVTSSTRKNGTKVQAYHRAPAGKSAGRSRPRGAVAATPSMSAPARNRTGRIERSSAARTSFERSHPCPATGKTSGPCPGYVIDHIRPLKRGGADAPSNMQWQTTAAAKAKDKIE